MGLTRMYLSGRYWRFGRTDGPVIAESIRLRRDGTIEGYHHPNQARWELDNAGALCFLREDRVVTTRFRVEQLTPEPAKFVSIFQFDENITYTLMEIGRVERAQHNDLPEILLVRPSLGHPLLLTPEQLMSFEVTFAGTSVHSPQPADLLKFRLSLAKNGKSLAQILPKDVIEITNYSSIDAHDPPRSAREHQYQAGFRWEARIQVGISSSTLNSLNLSAVPILFDMMWWPSQKEPSFIYHCIYISRLHDKHEIKFLHITDTHLSRRNDVIPEVLAETRNRHEARQLRLRYNNFNDDLRAVIRFANQNKVDFVVVTGDLVDYYHDGVIVYVDTDGEAGFYQDYAAGEPEEQGGWLGRPAQETSNVRKFLEIITGQDGRGEALACPIFCVPGNHEYLSLEPPLEIDFTVWISVWPVFKKKYASGFGLNDQEQCEFEFWKCTKGDSLPERLKRRRDGEQFNPVKYSVETMLLFGTPEFDNFPQYLVEISFDTDFTVPVGPYRFICLNTGEDVCVPPGGFYLSDPGTWILSTCEKHYLDDQTHNRGFLPQHIQMIEKAAQEAKSQNGLTFIFTHAPLIRERVPADDWPGDTSKFEGWGSGNLPDDEGCYYKDQMQKQNTIPGLDGCTAQWNEGCPGTLINWLQMGASNTDVILSGHSHDIHEYRARYRPQICKGNYAKSLSQSQEKIIWLGQHRPLLLISGCVKGSKREFRQITVVNNYLDNIAMQEVAKLSWQDNTIIRNLFTALSIDLARFGGYKNSARNDLCSAIHFRWAQAVNDKLRVMWDLMEKYGLQLANIEYLENVYQLDGEAMQEDLRQQLRRVDAAIAYSIPEFARIAGKYPSTDWWYDAQEFNRRKMQFYAICVANLNSFGVNFGSSEKNSLDLKAIYELGRHKTNVRMQDEIEERIAKLIDFAYGSPSNILALWSARESIYLASFGGYKILQRNLADPFMHLSWACTLPPDAILADMLTKYQLQAEHVFLQGGMDSLHKFYGLCCARLSAWRASDNPCVPEDYYTSSVTMNDQQILDALINQVKQVGIALST